MKTEEKLKLIISEMYHVKYDFPLVDKGRFKMKPKNFKKDRKRKNKLQRKARKQ